ncbi:MAG: hypothetical protein RSE41_02160 [Clostridia bacterium]
MNNYFLNNGKNINKDTINIEKNVKIITVYIEDNAGNSYYEYVNVKDNVFSTLLTSI